MNRIKKILITIHWIGLFSSIVLYGILKSISSKDDKIISALSSVFLSVSIIWACLAFIAALMFGDEDRLMEKMSSGYRRMLDSLPLLFVFNILSLSVTGYFAYIILFYQNVEFYAKKRAEIFLNDEPREVYQVGFVEPDEITSYRLRVGRRQLLYKFLDEPDSSAVLPIDVGFAWQNDKTLRITLKPTHAYDTLHTDEEKP